MGKVIVSSYQREICHEVMVRGNLPECHGKCGICDRFGGCFNKPTVYNVYEAKRLLYRAKRVKLYLDTVFDYDYWLEHQKRQVRNRIQCRYKANHKRKEVRHLSV